MIGLKTNLILSVIAVLIFAVLSHSAYAATFLHGTVTSCSYFYNCHFTVNNSTGTGYVTITGPAVYFKLPGEASVTSSQLLPYGFTGTAVQIGHSSAGTLYNVTGKFMATDANSGRIVKGSTDVVVAVRTFCSRTCGTTYSAVNGTIHVTETDKISGQTVTSLACNPSNFIQGGSTKCTASVTNQATQNTVIPTGLVTFAASNIGLGSFSSTSCTLSSGSCSVNFISNAEAGAGTTSIYSSYHGDKTHTSSAGRTVVYVTPCNDC